MTYTAHLCFILGTDDPTNLEYRRWEIFSSHPASMTVFPGEIYGSVLEVSSDESYSDAKIQLLTSIESLAKYIPVYAEAWLWVDPSREAHNARFDLLEARAKRKLAAKKQLGITQEEARKWLNGGCGALGGPAAEVVYEAVKAIAEGK